MAPTLDAPLDLRVLQPTDHAAVSRLRREVLGSLGDADWYCPEDDEDAFVSAHLTPPSSPASARSGETIGYFNGAELVAYAMVGYPGVPAADAHAFDGVALPNAHAVRPVPRQRVALLASCMVKPEFRGRALQRRLLAARFALAQTAGKELCLAMVSLRNDASRQNLMREGLKVWWVGHWHGLQRQVLGIDLVHATQFDPASTQWASSLDFDHQVALIRQGCWGIAEFRTPIGIDARRPEPVGHDKSAATLVFAQPLRNPDSTRGKGLP